MIKSGDHLAFPGTGTVPWGFFQTLFDRSEGLEDVSLYSLSTWGNFPYGKPEFKGRFRNKAFYLTQSARKAWKNRWGINIIPVTLFHIAHLFDQHKIPVDVTVLHVTPPNEEGYCSLGPYVTFMKNAMQASKIVIGQMNDQLLWTMGDSLVHMDEIDYLVPILTAVNGYALGGGCELALSGDLIFVSTSSEFGLPEAKLGIIPGVGGTQTIGRFLPRVHSLKMLLTGERMKAQEAYQFGMVNQVVEINEGNELVDLALETADQIANNSPFAVKMAKKAFTTGMDMPLEEGIDFSLECYNETLEHPDRKEGVKAFNEKRAPQFKDSL